MVRASPELEEYFASIKKDCFSTYKKAQEARKQGYDPTQDVEITLAATLAERVVGLISVIAPQVHDSKVAERIEELEQQYGVLDWRVGMKIALEIAQEKYVQFKSQPEAIDIGVRVGFAYVTLGVVSSPIEGITNIELRNRRDNRGQFFRINYAGPIRNAGGTAAAVSVLIADYVRKHLGYDVYDPTEKEMQRCAVELEDYHRFVANLQYFPSPEESEFLIKNIPVEIAGDASEKKEVSNVNLKDLPRIETNNLRSGYCLIHSSCIPLKAPKLWKRLAEWGEEMGMQDWNFLEEYVNLQKKMKAKGSTKEESDEKISPDYTYISDLVAGRPVLGHPLRSGAFRLRYGRSRTSGYSGQAIHPATMIALDGFLATGTQLKVERPGKAAAYTPCDTIEGPVVKLKDGSVHYLKTQEEAEHVAKQIDTILYLGDVLVNYGDFLDRAHSLIPAGYCEEWWVQELCATLDKNNPEQDLAQKTNMSSERVKELLSDVYSNKPTAEEALRIAQKTQTPLHPAWTPFFREITNKQLYNLLQTTPDKYTKDHKETLELLGIPHALDNEKLVLNEGWQTILKTTLTNKDDKLLTSLVQEDNNTLTILQQISPITIRDKSGTFIGSRMGRPEKAKMRKLTGSPHTLFPVGDQGGRLRSFQAALEAGYVNSAFPKNKCGDCNIETPLFRCELCDNLTTPMHLTKTNYQGETEQTNFEIWDVPIKRIFDGALKKLHMRTYPDLIKGVRGTANKSHIPEHLTKGILRARHNVHVNKDGTVRYDASELTLTHFKPKEARVSVERLRNLGYTKDIYGLELEHDEQILEIKPQDIILPCCDHPKFPDEPADKVLYNTANFVDELLVKLYGQEPYYNLKTPQDLVGHYIIGLAPHTSAGIVGRIIGFSKTQGFLAHPLLHAAMRRDCFTKETTIPILKDNLWTLKTIGELVEELKPNKIVDDYGTKEVKVKGYKTIGYLKGKQQEVTIKNFTKHTEQPITKVTTKLGRTLRVTNNHKQIVVREGKEQVVLVKDLQPHDIVKIPYNYKIKTKDVKEINLLEELKSKDWLMVRGLVKQVPNLREELRKEELSKITINNYVLRDSVPVKNAYKIIKKHKVDAKKLFLAAKHDTINVPLRVPLTKELLTCIGLYVAEGYAREQKGLKGSYQVYVAAQKKEIRDYVQKTFKELFNLKPSEKKTDRVTFSSRILYELFVNVFGAGRSAYEKRIPEKLLTLPKKRMGHILSGYFEGDGSCSANDLRLTFDTVSQGLIRDLEFVFAQQKIFVKFATTTRLPGKKLLDFYEKKNKDSPKFICTKGTIQSKFVHKASKHIKFLSREKRQRQEQMLKKKHRNLFCEFDEEFFYDEIITIEEQAPEITYCLNVEGNKVLANSILTKQCDGDESCYLLLMDSFLNFSKKYLPESRGGTMDAPLVLTYFLNPAEVDDMAFNIERTSNYPVALYEAALEYKKPWDVKMEIINDVLGSPGQFEGLGFTHDTGDFNKGVTCSSYKTLPSMREKMDGQLSLAKKIRAVDESDVAKLIITKHFMRDTKGNLAKFSQQQFRCVTCNAKYRRPPLRGNCTACAGKVIFTISEGSVIKYLEPSLKVAREFKVDSYLLQDLELTKRRIEANFGKDAERQEGLGKFFG